VTPERPQSESERRDALLYALEKILELPAAELRSTLDRASELVGNLLHADKVDTFLLEPQTQTLVAIGTSDTPMVRRQKGLGLDRLQLANRGRIVQVFESGEPGISGHVEDDPEELPGIKHGLGVRSFIAVPFDVEGVRRGVLECSSAQPDFFSPDDLRFLGAVSRWVGAVVHRSELVEELTKSAAEQGRRAAADELITVFAHDMGNHLFALRVRIEMLHQRAVREKAAANLRDSEAALKSLAGLSRFTSDLLDVGRLDQGLFALRLQPLEVMGLVGELAAALAMPKNEVQVRGPTELVIQADAARLRQALSNLVANALKHSPAGLPIVIEVAAQDRQDGKWVLITVADQGAGVPPHLLPRLFERFVRGSNSQGLGLGLYLARQIAVAHGGTLEAQSQPGKGARFEIALPLDREEQGP
jgi:signal transduction histidine kinase